MTLQQLNYVIAIAEAGSFNRAAERLYIAQPSLTSAIKELEKEIGVILFNRSGRGATLTADGAEFLPYARSVMTQYQNLLDAYRAFLRPKVWNHFRKRFSSSLRQQHQKCVVALSSSMGMQNAPYVHQNCTSS